MNRELIALTAVVVTLAMGFFSIAGATAFHIYRQCGTLVYVGWYLIFGCN